MCKGLLPGIYMFLIYLAHNLQAINTVGKDKSDESK